MVNIIVLVRNIIKKFVLVDGYCKKCGSTRNMVFYVSDDTWRKVTNDSTKEFCLPCFVDMARQRGVMLFLDEWA